MTDHHHKFELPKVSRRKFLRSTTAGMGLLAFGSFLQFVPYNRAVAAPKPSHKRLVVLFLRGGNDGMNTIVPVTRNRYYDRRGGILIYPQNALALNGTNDYMMHSAMPKVAQIFNDGDMAIIQKVGYPDANLSHFVSEDIWSFGVRGSFAKLNVPISGWIARYADLYASGSPMGVVSVGQGIQKDFVGARQSKPFIVDDLAGFQFDVAGNHTNNHYLRLDFAREMLANGGQQTPVRQQIHEATLQSYDLSDQVQQAVANYQQSVQYYTTQALSRRFRDIARLIQGGFDTQIFYTGAGGFDTHSEQANTHSNLLGTVDLALGSFVADLKNMGVWNDTAIVVMSEFGRRNSVNGSLGTDHGHGNCMFVLGGAVNGGIYGSDITDADIDLPWLDYETDFRSVLKHVIERHLGKDPNPVLPEIIEKPGMPGVLI